MKIDVPIRYRLTVKAVEYLKTREPIPRGREGLIKTRRGWVRARRIKFSTDGPAVPRADVVQLQREEQTRRGEEGA